MSSSMGAASATSLALGICSGSARSRLLSEAWSGPEYMPSPAAPFIHSAFLQMGGSSAGVAMMMARLAAPRALIALLTANPIQWSSAARVFKFGLSRVVTLTVARSIALIMSGSGGVLRTRAATLESGVVRVWLWSAATSRRLSQALSTSTASQAVPTTRLPRAQLEKSTAGAPMPRASSALEAPVARWPRQSWAARRLRRAVSSLWTAVTSSSGWDPAVRRAGSCACVMATARRKPPRAFRCRTSRAHCWAERSWFWSCPTGMCQRLKSSSCYCPKRCAVRDMLRRPVRSSPRASARSCFMVLQKSARCSAVG
mmetsp:Transcript_93854/g.265500  ORF Transcript_93854/g.265500 Transcript_93854/m.265500 type:complete len:314 (+) Transcript_93854:228-1169(+)